MDLKQYKLVDLYTMSSGLSSKPEQAGHGAPFVSFSTIFNNHILPNEIEDKMDTSIEEQIKYSIKKGDVLITRTSETLDELAMTSVALKDYPSVTFSGFAKRLRPTEKNIKQKITYDKYMAFFFRSDYFRKIINNMATMTLRASFNEQILSYIKIYLPSYEYQVKIGDMLYNIHCQIENNNKMIKKLQVLSQNIFNKYYGKSMYEFNGMLNDLCSLPSGYSFEPTYYVPNGKYKLITIKNVNGIFVDCERVDTLNEIPPKMKSYCKLEKCDILISLTGNVGRISINSLSNCLLNQRVSKLICDEKYKLYLYLLLNTNYYQSKMNQMASGTSQKNLSPLDVENLNIHIPNNIDEFYSATKNIFIQLCDINSFSIRLQNMKNKLLPLLINGQIQ